MGNCLLSNFESVCKFFFRLSRIFLQELLQFLVFEFFRLTRSFSVGKVKIPIAKSLELFFTRFICVTASSHKAEQIISVASAAYFFSIGIQIECSVSNAPCRMPLLSLMIFEVKFAAPPPIAMC